MSEIDDRSVAAADDEGRRRQGGYIGEPIALRAYWTLRDLSVADMEYVLAVTGRRMRVAGESSQMTRARLSVQCFMDEHDGLVPTRKQLDQWIKADDAPAWRRQLAPSSTVRRAFGSWDAMRGELESKAVLDFASRRLRAPVQPHEEETCLRLLEEWCGEQPDDLPMLRDDFSGWIRDRHLSGVAEQDDPASWGSMGRVFPTWTAALERAGYPGRDGTGGLPRLKSRWSTDELKVIVRVFAAGDQPRTAPQFAAFLAEQHEMATCGLHDMPESVTPFLLAFGTFNKALEAAGVTARPWYRDGDPRHAPEGRFRLRLPEGPVVAPDDLDEEQLDRFWVREAARLEPQGRLSRPLYGMARQALAYAAEQAGLPEPIIAHSNTLIRRYAEGGGWRDVQRWAGLEPCGPLGRPRVYSDDALCDFAARLLHANAGRPLTVPRCQKLRAAEEHRLREAGESSSVPTPNILKYRLSPGDWKGLSVVARERAVELGLALDGSPLPYLWKPDPPQQTLLRRAIEEARDGR